MDRDLNVIGAVCLAVADSIREVTETQAGRAGARAAALSSLLGWADGHPIEALAAGVNASHSHTVRVLDALAADGLIMRKPHHNDGRKVVVHLTAAGRREARQIVSARADALERLLDGLSSQQRAALADASAAIIGNVVANRIDARRLCRLCDTASCGHESGHCPSTRAADAAEGV